MGFRNTNAAPGLAFDQPPILFNITTGVNGTLTFGPFDVSQYQCIIVQAAHDIINANTMDLVFLWQAVSPINPLSGTLISSDRFRWVAGDNASMIQPLPCRGNRLSLTFTCNNAAALNQIILTGSNRTFQEMMTSVNSRVILSQLTAALAAGATTTAIGPATRYDGPCYVYNRAFGGAASVGTIMQITDLVNNNVIEFVTGGNVINGVSHAQNRFNCVLPRNSWSVTVTSLAAVAQQVEIEFLSSPEGN